MMYTYLTKMHKKIVEGAQSYRKLEIGILLENSENLFIIINMFLLSILHLFIKNTHLNKFCLDIISKYITNLTLISFTSCNMVTNIFSTITHALTSFTKSRMHTGCCTICSIITNLASHNFS